MVLLLAMVSGLAWTVVYVECIRVGLRERTYAMPLAALALNFAWESTYAAQGLAESPDPQTVINIVWAVLDVGIIVTFCRFGRAEFPGLGRGTFAGLAVLTFAASYVVQWLFIAQFGRHDAAQYSAFLQNLLMSALFLAMFAARRGARGQSLLIAVAKWIGTLAPTILFGVVFGSPFVLGLGILCSVLDLVYAGVLWHARSASRRPGAVRSGTP
ncbi:transmembrane-type terpene cyclase [Nonomuraea aridisoli]|uniref:Uncharacterized protein n=1 Tax=Nonomuraea aridisoli TaxID=2070368 RepID=A0A2W2EQT6_9ACTN|nr:hypothetical protein [Nonomuraea aridisoli]PZG18935.1 hypothetical protein C1J01_13490 [Nonomuraea aridisoli]